MLDLNPFKDILTADFDCLAEPPLEGLACPCLNKSLGPVQDTNGMYTCPKCSTRVGQEDGEDTTLFDEDDEEENAFADGVNFVAEGERHIRWTPEEDKVVRRRNKVHELATLIMNRNNSMAVYMEKHEKEISLYLREIELSDEPAFKTRNLAPKIMAVVLTLMNKPTDEVLLRDIKVNPRTVARLRKSLQIIAPAGKEENEMIRAIRYICNSIDIPKGMVDIIVEQYDQNPLTNREEDTTTRGAAFTYLKLRQSGHRITIAQLKSISGVKVNAFDRAVASYREQMRNGNNRVESESVIDED